MDKSYIEYICSLARLEFDEKDLNKIIERLNAINGYAEKLAELDTNNIEPLVNVNEIVNVMREDEVKPSLDRNIVLNNTSEKMYGCIKVSKIIE